MAARARPLFALFCLIIPTILIQGAAASAEASAQRPPEVARKDLLTTAASLLEEAQISYVYGGYQVGDGTECKQCNDCLGKFSPKPDQRLVKCGVCRRCSLDCSHFTELVYRQAGMPYPYIDTKLMLSLSAAQLRDRYGLVDFGTNLEQAEPGDLLVYNGHVVLLERRHDPEPDLARYRGDVVHATGGRDIKRPGEGIQRERFVDLERFRGPLRRILRHQALTPAGLTAKLQKPLSAASPKAERRLRPVAKRPRNDD